MPPVLPQGCPHASCKNVRSQGQAEWKDGKLVGFALKYEPEKFPVLWVDRNVKVFVFEVYGGEPIS